MIDESVDLVEEELDVEENKTAVEAVAKENPVKN